MPTALRSDRSDDKLSAQHPADRHSRRTSGKCRIRTIVVIGLLAVTSSALYFVSDVIEVVQGRFSTGQLWLTLVGEAAVPVFVIGLWLVQRPRIGRLGAMTATTYAYSFVFFTGTVVYALVRGSRDIDQLGAALDPAMTIHGALMVIAAVGFGYAVVRAGALPRWTGIALAIGVVLIPLSIGAADGMGLIAVGLRDLAFAGMGAAILRSRSASGGPTPAFRSGPSPARLGTAPARAG